MDTSPTLTDLLAALAGGSGWPNQLDSLASLARRRALAGGGHGRLTRLTPARVGRNAGYRR
jgi:hypothetical protein